MSGEDKGANNDTPVEYKPHFHEWATVQPGMICLARKKKTAVFRQYVAAETAVPVIASKITADRLRSLSPQIPRETLHPQIFTVTDFVKFYHHRL